MGSPARWCFVSFGVSRSAMIRNGGRPRTGGDEDFSVFCARWRPEVRMWARERLRDEHEAEDVVQQVLVAPRQSRDAYRAGRGTVRARLFGMTSHGIHGAPDARCRRQAHRQRHVGGTLPEYVENAVAQEVVGRPHVDGLLRSLPPLGARCSTWSILTDTAIRRSRAGAGRRRHGRAPRPERLIHHPVVASASSSV
ncbi:RNA polymerase sigma factor [Streptomyces sp. NPDC090093]|uniref:RNA polymerase sigma factor n=1 Tax=Streptomyces sp. NPDC090093 TaxID=3365945 RepID=UPI003830272E